MANNRFKDLTDTVDLENKTKQHLDDAVSKERLAQSNDFRGSSTSLLFDASEQQMLKEFIDHMRRNHFPSSEPVSLSVKRTGRVLDAREQLSEPISKAKKIARKLSWIKLWSGRGYFVGVYVPEKIPSPDYSHCSTVYICSDGKLRCRRSTPLFIVGHSRAKGYGTIPTNIQTGVVFKVGKFNNDNHFDFRSFSPQTLERLLNEYVLENFSSK